VVWALSRCAPVRWRPDELVHLVLDVLDASIPGEPTML
jgi:hypothetical protein